MQINKTNNNGFDDSNLAQASPSSILAPRDTFAKSQPVSPINIEKIEKKWDYETGGAIYCSPFFSEDVENKNLVVGSGDGKVYVLDPETGSNKWDFKTGDISWFLPRLSQDGKTFTAGSGDGNVYTLKFSTKEEIIGKIRQTQGQDSPSPKVNKETAEIILDSLKGGNINFSKTEAIELLAQGKEIRFIDKDGAYTFIKNFKELEQFNAAEWLPAPIDTNASLPIDWRASAIFLRRHRGEVYSSKENLKLGVFETLKYLSRGEEIYIFDKNGFKNFIKSFAEFEEFSINSL
ncbi:MAG: PQQ-binding-like beta-propeller repeat protein [Armatimonadetes bacterium]|nr:PQQ-binding-like beta-propeller repeat protein [Armatimonadota bacterium]